MSYGKVVGTFWTDPKLRGLDSDATVLAFYLMFGPHSNLLGVSRVPDGYVATDLGRTIAEVRTAFAKLHPWFIARDALGWTQVLDFLEREPPTNPNHMRAIRLIAEGVPLSSAVRGSVDAAIAAAAAGMNKRNGFLYVIGRADKGGPLKIGYAKSPSKRLPTIRRELLRAGRADLAESVVLYAAEVVGGIGRLADAEAAAHRQLGAPAFRNEWFAVEYDKAVRIVTDAAGSA